MLASKLSSTSSVVRTPAGVRGMAAVRPMRRGGRRTAVVVEANLFARVTRLVKSAAEQIGGPRARLGARARGHGCPCDN